MHERNIDNIRDERVHAVEHQNIAQREYDAMEKK